MPEVQDNRYRGPEPEGDAEAVGEEGVGLCLWGVHIDTRACGKEVRHDNREGGQVLPLKPDVLCVRPQEQRGEGPEGEAVDLSPLWREPRQGRQRFQVYLKGGIENDCIGIGWQGRLMS